jgi:RNA polymerase sigma-70 factor (ECF subfamily)
MADRQRARATLETILNRMPDEQRIVFTLFEFDEMTGDEIADLLDLPVGTVRSRLRLARATFERSVARLRSRETPRLGLALSPSEAR